MMKGQNPNHRKSIQKREKVDTNSKSLEKEKIPQKDLEAKSPSDLAGNSPLNLRRSLQLLEAPSLFDSSHSRLLQKVAHTLQSNYGNQQTRQLISRAQVRSNFLRGTPPSSFFEKLHLQEDKTKKKKDEVTSKNVESVTKKIYHRMKNFTGLEVPLVFPSKMKNYSRKEVNIASAAILVSGMRRIQIDLKEMAQLAQTKDEIAFILAHEFAHVAMEHNKKNMKKKGELAYTYANSSQRKRLRKGEASVEKIFAEVAQTTPKIKDKYYAHCRAMERQADQLGLYLMNNMGYDTSGAAASLKHRKDVYKYYGWKKTEVPTHPSEEERIENIEDWSEDLQND